MPIPPAFNQASDWHSLQVAIHNFGDATGVGEEDLIAALHAMEGWRERFTDSFTIDSHGEKITWCRYENLTWSLGESFRRIILHTTALRKSERVFGSVCAICLDDRFGKGRQSFIMLLGQYGGPLQINALIDLLDDPEVCGQAIYALRLLGAVEAAEKVRLFLHSPKKWIKQESLKYFQKIQ
jgi:hypothetical protein